LLISTKDELVNTIGIYSAFGKNIKSFKVILLEAKIPY